MNITPTTTLGAVNTMLETISAAPINSLQDIDFTDAAVALDALEATSREAQSRGFYFNTDEEYTFQPAADGRVELPATVLSVTPSPSETRRIAVRAGYLYDRDAATDDFTGQPDPVVTVVWQLDFEKLPEAARRYITVRAARIFQTQVQGDEKIDVFTKEYEEEAAGILNAEQHRYATLARFSTSYTATSELEAVNTILIGCKQPPVTTLPTTGFSKASAAHRLVREASRSLQCTSWYFNTIENYAWPLQGGKAVTDPGILTILPSPAEDRSVGLRGTTLIDRSTGSDIWPEEKPPITKVIEFLPFEELPESARQLIVRQAGLDFQNSLGAVRFDSNGNGSKPLPVFSEKATVAALLQLRREQQHWDEPANMMTDSPDVSDIWLR